MEQISLMKPRGADKTDTGLLEYLEDIIGTDKYVEAIEEQGKRRALSPTDATPFSGGAHFKHRMRVHLGGMSTLNRQMSVQRRLRRDHTSRVSLCDNLMIGPPRGCCQQAHGHSGNQGIAERCRSSD